MSEEMSLFYPFTTQELIEVIQRVATEKLIMTSTDKHFLLEEAAKRLQSLLDDWRTTHLKEYE